MNILLLAMTLFGINLAPLYDAIAQVESDRGIISKNIYQIKRIYWEDVNRFRKCSWHTSSYSDIVSFKGISEDYMYLYWEHYGKMYEKETGRKPTAEILSKMHNRGGRYWKQDKETQKAAERYWKRVKKHYLKNLKIENQ